MCQEIGKYSITWGKNQPIETKLKIKEMIEFRYDLKSIIVNRFSVPKYLRST